MPGEKISPLESVFYITSDICIKVPDKGRIDLASVLFLFLLHYDSTFPRSSDQCPTEEACPDLLVLAVSQGS